MAINKLVAINSGSTPVSGDWARLVEYQNAFMRQVNSGQIITDGVYLKQGSYIQHGGVLYRVDDEDYTILGSLTASVFNYIVIEDNGTGVLTATWATDISGYNWNYIYSELLASDESGVLPYAERDGAVYLTINQFNGSNHKRIQISDTTDVNPSSTNNPFQIGEDDEKNLVADANQILCRDGDGSTFSDLSVNSDEVTGTYGNVRLGNILPIPDPTSGSQTIASEATWTPPRGVYVWSSSDGVLRLSVDGGSTYNGGDRQAFGTFFTDGSHVVIKNDTTSTPIETINYLKF